MQLNSLDLLRRLACARGIEFRPDRLPRSGWLRASDAVRLHYLDWPGEGETLLLLHGGALSAYTFDLVALALPSDIRCVALDLRGHGSEWANEYPVDRHAADVVELADSLGLSEFHLAGMSLGGCVAGHAAPMLGKRLRSYRCRRRGEFCRERAHACLLFPDPAGAAGRRSYRPSPRGESANGP